MNSTEKAAECFGGIESIARRTSILLYQDRMQTAEVLEDITAIEALIKRAKSALKVPEITWKW